MKQVFCQSCAMPMKKPEDFGTEKDGAASAEFCVYCYKAGAYTAPKITMDEMLKIGLDGIDKNTEMNGIMKFFIKKMYPSQLKKLKRWS